MGGVQSNGANFGGSTMGYQVLRVYPNSPGSRAGLKAYFDFIVAIGSTRFNQENGAFREILKSSIDQKLQMHVYNTRTKTVREVEIVPSTSWGGNGLLGVSIKHSSFDRADERVWHVVEVEPGSPAQQAGFIAKDDFVIGSDSILQENDDLYNLIESHEGKALKLFVYNVKSDNCREVICHPNSKWGGKGYLGCEFGHGLLHRIPYLRGDDISEDNPRASLLRNEHSPGETNPPAQIPNLINQTQQFQQRPGHELLQQALSDNRPQQSPSMDRVLPPVPQTFAQLANAQFQTQQYQPHMQSNSLQSGLSTVANQHSTGLIADVSISTSQATNTTSMYPSIFAQQNPAPQQHLNHQQLPPPPLPQPTQPQELRSPQPPQTSPPPMLPPYPQETEIQTVHPSQYPTIYQQQFQTQNLVERMPPPYYPVQPNE